MTLQWFKRVQSTICPCSFGLPELSFLIVSYYLFYSAQWYLYIIVTTINLLRREVSGNMVGEEEGAGGYE